MKEFVKETLLQLGFIGFVFCCPLLVLFLLEAFR